MRKIFLLSLVLSSILWSSCSSDDPEYPDNLVNFQSAELGFDEKEASKTITVSIGRAVATESTITLSVASTGVTYGTDYTTSPEQKDSKISLTIPAGQTSATLTVNKKAALFDGTEKLKFEIVSATTDLVLGQTKELNLGFSAILSQSGTMTLNGGDGAYAAINSVYVDFSANEQVSVLRKSWSLGFHNGDFAVLLNTTLGSTAVEATVQDMTKVISTADSTAYASKLRMGQGDGTLSTIDDVTGNLSKCVIKEGKVYVLNIESGTEPLYKVKVTKSGSKYTIQYAKSNESTVKSLEVATDEKYNFSYASLTDNKVVTVEPEKSKWDIVYGRSTYKTSDGTKLLPYIMSDYIRINKYGGVTAAIVETSVSSYEKFNAETVKSVTFSSDLDAIGEKWRSVLGGGVFANKFIVIKDPAGNVYKMKFNKIGVASDGGNRGYPELEYALVK